jgi:hypothetical protein
MFHGPKTMAGSTSTLWAHTSGFLLLLVVVLVSNPGLCTC